MTSTQATSSPTVTIEDRFLLLKQIVVDYTRLRPNRKLRIKLKDEMGTQYESKMFEQGETLQWNCEIYVKSPSVATMTIQSFGGRFRRNQAVELRVDFGSTDFRENCTAERADVSNGITIKLTFGMSGKNINVARLLANKAVSAVSTKISMLESMEKVLGYFDVVLRIGLPSSEVHPCAKVAAGRLDAAFKRFQEIPTCHREFVAIVEDVVLLLPLLESLHNRIEDTAVLNILKSFIDIVERLTRDLDRYSSRSLPNFLRDNWYKSKQNEIKAFKGRLDLLCSTLNTDSTNVTSEPPPCFDGPLPIVSTREEDHRRPKGEESALWQLRPPANSSFDPKRCCLEGTRVDVLRTVDEWTRSTERYGQLYWIHGVAGCGKTSVAASISAELDSRKALSGSFFCSRDIPERRSSIRLVHSLVYFLARAYRPFEDSLLRLLRDNPRLVEEPLSAQCKAFLPCLHLKASVDTRPKPIVLVVDALDECEDSHSISSFIVKVLKLIPFLKLILTSRPLVWIQDALKSLEEWEFRVCDLFKVDSYVDTLRYTREEFKASTRLPRDFRDDQIAILAQKASGHFLWVVTILKHISSSPSGKEMLRDTISSARSHASSEEQLDAVYQRVLDDVCKDSAERTDAIKLILGLVFVTSRNRPIPARALHTFVPSDIRLEDFQSMLQELGSVLVEEPQTGVIRACHPSLLDFIGSARSKRYEVETAILDTNMAKKCLDIMIFGLKFNICSLESSHLRNDEVPDLSERVDREISKQLQYSCLYWLDHLSRYQFHGIGRTSIREKLRGVFFQLKSLYWLEALSLMSELKTAVSSLRDVPRLLKLMSIDDELGSTMSDLYRFAMAFHEPMAVSAPHIYISALLWTPSKSVIAQLHHGSFTSSKLVLEGLEKHWPVELRTLSVGSEVYSVAYSPDGRHIVSGSLDNTIHVWDAATGMPVGESFQGHEKMVCSVVFAPNGCRIVSGSDDCTVRIWNVEAGTPVGEPLHGHKCQVLSVACSPDGCHAVSGSRDRCIRIWNTETGAPVSEPYCGHNGVVSCIAYSPDARYIVSGSYDSTVRVWDAATGRPVSRRFRGHGQQVSSVAYSPDGQYIASGSHDNTIRIWDAGSYSPVGEPIRGHKSAVISIAYSRDGLRIVSGSADKTIFIWDAKTGIPISEPLRGHEGSVASVSYSPDGRHIVSGSVDKTIRIWDTETVTSTLVPYTLEGHGVDATSSDLINLIRDAGTGELYQWHETNTDPDAYSPDGRYSVSGSDGCTIHIWDIELEAPVGEPLQGHDLPVCSVAFSPDSRRIVSGSEDATIRIWDVTTGGIIGPPLRGHEGRVHAVIYSPDGRHIVSASYDKSIRIWDAESSILAGHLDKTQDGWIGFSQDGKYTLSYSNRDNKLVRIPPFIQIDGWIRTSDGRLLLWVPHEYRNRVCDMSLASFSHYAPSHPVRIDWARLPHGTTWTSVKIDNWL